MSHLDHLDDPAPPDPDGFRGAVHLRARHYIARRRRMMATATAAAVMAAVAIPLALAAPRPTSTNVVADEPPHDPAQATTSSTSTPEASTSTAPTTSTTTQSGAAISAPPRTTETTAPAPQECAPSDWEAVARPARATYAPGERITFHVEARNISTKHCRHLPRVEQITIRDSEGRPVESWRQESGYMPPASSATPSGIAPGQTWVDAVTWDQRAACDGCDAPAQVQPGTYVLDPEWVFDVTAAVEITSG